MKLTPIKELRSLDSSKLKKQLDELQAELSKQSFESRTDKSDNMHSMRNIKKQIARIKGILTTVDKETE